MKSKIYVFEYDDYYPSGGVHDLFGVFDTLEQAKDAISSGTWENVDFYRIDDQGKFIDADTKEIKKLSTGEPSTLRSYKGMAILYGEKAVEFIQRKIDESPNGEDEEVWSDERQMMGLLYEIGKA